MSGKLLGLIFLNFIILSLSSLATKSKPCPIANECDCNKRNVHCCWLNTTQNQWWCSQTHVIESSTTKWEYLGTNPNGINLCGKKLNDESEGCNEYCNLQGNNINADCSSSGGGP